MLNVAVFSGLCLFVFVQAIPAPGHGALEGYCNTNSDCSIGECCISIGRKDSLTDDLKRLVSGKCEKRGKDSSTCVKQCKSTTDCRRNECCVSKVQPRGKRSTEGHCQPMGTARSRCLVSNGSGRPEGVLLHSCPCAEPLLCYGSGLFEIPLGETGTCI